MKVSASECKEALCPIKCECSKINSGEVKFDALERTTYIYIKDSSSSASSCNIQVPSVPRNSTS